MDPSHIQEISVRVVILIISTSRTEKEDTTGKAISSLLHSSSIPVIRTKVIPDDIEKIQVALKESLEEVNCIILTGGTGITHDDCTIEAVEPLLEKRLDGFGELFRMKSYAEVGTRTVLSRALGGVIDGKAVFCIPGSKNAAELATREIIIPEILHILTHASR
ncbi:MAG TPA: MogA/MoaB family molybdenum cofactor biosynthesis protein [Methanospirillum sp.]|jgi:molybdenum cofactor biosynthesis protein B|uniref:MogA/MoaB family molybdenum cofactor biosynthesis protein n=1 Tax=Methanospirillum sp. TaxID=45200 RepID=UPI0009C8B11E|nr:MogA/MoaB family molybdenum cofactor biosynthesis protein [Methanospirillum sp.]OQB36364.1 MAG: Molybdopterin adenylyltransferase [Euryarchaeota archaeon ADurb.Bin165]HPY59564.1 MogA/MoaB family molybdenum cofactor biosynthesis protein [Methanospirillum sp.]HQB99502.1 MogA/MoaB family molybdenum cofactor biosynthesis protein [Methanospirillum sp.]